MGRYLPAKSATAARSSHQIQVVQYTVYSSSSSVTRWNLSESRDPLFPPLFSGREDHQGTTEHTLDREARLRSEIPPRCNEKQSSLKGSLLLPPPPLDRVNPFNCLKLLGRPHSQQQEGARPPLLVESPSKVREMGGGGEENTNFFSVRCPFFSSSTTYLPGKAKDGACTVNMRLAGRDAQYDG